LPVAFSTDHKSVQLIIAADKQPGQRAAHTVIVARERSARGICQRSLRGFPAKATSLPR
jgi:hypothetical protein